MVVRSGGEAPHFTSSAHTMFDLVLGSVNLLEPELFFFNFSTLCIM